MSYFLANSSTPTCLASPVSKREISSAFSGASSLYFATTSLKLFGETPEAGNAVQVPSVVFLDHLRLVIFVDQLAELLVRFPVFFLAISIAIVGNVAARTSHLRSGRLLAKVAKLGIHILSAMAVFAMICSGSQARAKHEMQLLLFV